MVNYAQMNGQFDEKPEEMSERWGSHRHQRSDPALLGLARAEQPQRQLNSNQNLEG